MENRDKPATGYGFANEQSHHEEQGLTKREYFAGLAMQGILATKHNPGTMWVANESIAMADALLKQLENK